MVVISLSDCPPKVRGDLSKWLCEINTGVYVGNISARVRDELWERVCENIGSGRATMVFSASGEQKMDFRVHNTTWEPVDLDGIKLMRRPVVRDNDVNDDLSGFSKAANIRKARNINTARQRKMISDDYVIIDLETTGISYKNDRIIEIAALRVRDGEHVDEFSSLIKIDENIPAEISALTGISDDDINKYGRDERAVINEFIDFIGSDKLVGHNISFDLSFLRVACKRCETVTIKNISIDTLSLSRKKLNNVSDYQLTTVAKAMNIDTESAHRALKDCYITYRIYEKLK